MSASPFVRRPFGDARDLAATDIDQRLRELAAMGVSMAGASQRLRLRRVTVMHWALAHPEIIWSADMRSTLRKLAAEGLTIGQAAARVGLPVRRLRHTLRGLDDPEIVFVPAPRPTAFKPRPVAAPPAPRPLSGKEHALVALTPAQRADYDLLVKRGKYGHDAALASVTRPRPRLRAIPALHDVRA